MSAIASSHRIRSISIIGGFLDGAKFDHPAVGCECSEAIASVAGNNIPLIV